MSHLFAVRSFLNRGQAVLWFGLFLFVLNVPQVVALNENVDLHGGKVQVREEQTGPFTVGGQDFTLVKKKLAWEGAGNGFDETVQSIALVDDQGNAHFQKSFRVDQGATAFMESLDVSAFALDSRGLKGFKVEGAKLVELPPKDRPGAGLLLSYGFVPAAPPAGGACQVFALKEGRLTPLFSPLTVNGRIFPLPPGSTASSRRLFENDTIRFGVWTGWFEVIVPLRVFADLQVAPIHYDMTYRFHALEVDVRRNPPGEDTFVRLFSRPSETDIPGHIIVKKDSKVEFIMAYARPVISKGVVALDGPPWLKLRIDGREGYIRDPEDLMALGIRQAG